MPQFSKSQIREQLLPIARSPYSSTPTQFTKLTLIYINAFNPLFFETLAKLFRMPFQLSKIVYDMQYMEIRM